MPRLKPSVPVHDGRTSWADYGDVVEWEQNFFTGAQLTVESSPFTQLGKYKKQKILSDIRPCHSVNYHAKLLSKVTINSIPFTKLKYLVWKRKNCNMRYQNVTSTACSEIYLWVFLFCFVFCFNIILLQQASAVFSRKQQPQNSLSYNKYLSSLSP